MKNKLINFQDFERKSSLFEETRPLTDQDGWDKMFKKVEDDKEKASGVTDSSPEWLKSDVKNDAFSVGEHSADERMKWLENKLNSLSVESSSSASGGTGGTGGTGSNQNEYGGPEIESIEKIEMEEGGLKIPGFRVRWKEGEKKEYSSDDNTFFMDFYKGKPGVYIKYKTNPSDPSKIGVEETKGFWGKSKTKSGGRGEIYYMTPPPLSSGSISSELGDMSVLDLFKETSMGQAIIGYVAGSNSKFKEYLRTGEISADDKLPSFEDYEENSTQEDREKQRERQEAMNASGVSVIKPSPENLREFTSSSDYVYNKDILEISWDKLKEVLGNAGVANKLNFNEYNIIGIRNSVETKNKFSNRYTDLIILMSPKEKKKVSVYPATTTPGLAFAYIPFRNWYNSAGIVPALNPDGPAILQPGVYEYKIGNYYTTKVLKSSKTEISRMPPVAEKSSLKFKSYTPGPTKTGDFEIFIQANMPTSEEGKNSMNTECSGQQVIKRERDFNKMLDELEKSPQTVFKYALINSSDLTKDSRSENRR